MKLMRLAIVAAFALVGGIAIAEDLDVQALQARLAAQEARLNDLQKKVGGSTSAYGFAADYAGDFGSCGPEAPESILSLNKVGTVKIGGEIGTRYYYHTGDIKTSLYRNVGVEPDVFPPVYDPGSPIHQPNSNYFIDGNGDVATQWDPGDRKTAYKVRRGDLKNSDAWLGFQIDVNDNFDAYIQLNMLDAGGYGNVAQKAYVRWKNVCNSGFGVLVGKSDLVFGEAVSMGVITPWTGGGGSEIAGYYGAYYDGNADWAASNGLLDTYIGYDHSRTVQINPYWESQDGKWRVEASLFSNIDWFNGGGRYSTTGGSGTIDDPYYRYDKSLNYGWGSASFRIRAKPIEGLMISASVINTHLQGHDDDRWANWEWDGAAGEYIPSFVADDSFGGGYTWGEKANSTATALAFKWNPCFMPRFGIWGQWVHNWNAGWQDATADAVNVGISYGFTDRFTAFVQGDYYYRKNKWAEGNPYQNYKTYAWASYVGLQYKLPYGVTTEIGWRHDNIDYKNSWGDKHTVARGDTIYGSLYFDF